MYGGAYPHILDHRILVERVVPIAHTTSAFGKKRS
jgi:hypothetical protein